MDTDANGVVSLHCSDGAVAISCQELEVIMKSGNVFRYLLYGGGGMCAERNVDVLRQFDVSKAMFNTLRACIRGLKPEDDIMQAALKSGELRNVADTLGGFGIVDDMIKIWEQKHILANMEIIHHPYRYGLSLKQL